MLPTATTTTQPLSPRSRTQFITRRLAVASTPARLSVLRAVLIVLALVFAVVGAFGVNRRTNAINEVRTASRQLLALQDIQVRIVHADAIASSSYLRSGQEDPSQRTAYLDEIAKAGDGLVAVSASATAADLEQLSSASRLLGSYVGLVEQARANNRQGFPVGAAYQRQANGIVSNADPDTPDIVSSLRAVEESQRTQINDSLASAHRAGVLLHVTGWLVFIALVVASWWMWRTFRRVVNVPVAIALLVLFLVLLIGGIAQAGAVSDTDNAVNAHLAVADRAAQARAAAFEARSQEALTLINRGNGAANEVNWQLGNDIVTREMSNALGSDRGLAGVAASAYASYAEAHVEIRALDNAGKWEQAVAISLGAQPTSKGINSALAFDGFDQAVGRIATAEGSAASAGLLSAVHPLNSLRIIVFIAGLVIAVLSALGCGQRLKEYR